jgi:ribonucleoside-diphosphate reductase alpha chain
LSTKEKYTLFDVYSTDNYALNQLTVIPSENEVKQIDENASKILKDRYYMQTLDGNKEKTFSELCQRVSKIVASAETLYTKDSKFINSLAESIYNDMVSKRFLFNSPCLFSAGIGLTNIKEYNELIYNNFDLTTKDYEKLYKNINTNQMLFACFIIPIDDSLEGIFNSVKDAAIISKFGGGVGTNFSHLREKNAEIGGGIGGKSSGPVSFMKTWNTMGSVVVQGGRRRAALMGMLNINHPDIEEFIECKTKNGELSYFNISVAIDDLFMQAVENDDDYNLLSPNPLPDNYKDNTKYKGAVIATVNNVNYKVVKIVKAKELWDKICNAAYKGGDPGVFFVDTANNDSLLKISDDYVIESTNPCGEQPLIISKKLQAGSSCNLGSINLFEFVRQETDTVSTFFDFNSFIAQIFRSMYYMDLVIDATKYPLKNIEENTKNIRPVGLGIMGLADTAIALGYKYGSKEFLDFSERIASIMGIYSLLASIGIGNKKDSFKAIDCVYDLLHEAYTNNDMSFEDFIKQINEDKTLYSKTKEECINYLNYFTTNNLLPYSFKNTLLAMINENKDIFIYALQMLLNKKLRNSRRLSIAPTGTIAIILNTSSSIEPNFAYEWIRKISKSETEKVDVKFYHKLYDKYKNTDLLVTAHDLNYNEHLGVVKVFAKYIDSAISKTVNLPKDAPVDDIKHIYDICYKSKIKGITIYRDGSRGEQPIQKIEKTDNKVENETINVISNKPNKTIIQKRPKIMPGITTKSDSPYGSIYVTLNFDDYGTPFELFVSSGKSGSISKSVTEALSRVISLALRAGVELNDIVNTIANISGSETWIYDTIDGKELYVRSIPDVVARMLADLNNYYNELASKYSADKTKSATINTIKNISVKMPEVSGEICPECGSTMVMQSGCSVCMNCGFSPCK